MSKVATKETLLSQTRSIGEVAMTLSEAMEKGKEWLSCGDHIRGFELRWGDVISIPSADQIFFWLKETTLKSKKVYLLHFSAQITSNGDTSWEWIPVWALRKRTRKAANDPTSLKSHALYQALLHASNDLARVEMLAGKAWKVTETTATEQDKDGKDYELKIWSLTEVSK